MREAAGSGARTPAERLAGLLHERMCGRKANGVGCVAWRSGRGSHWEYYTDRAAALYRQLEPQMERGDVAGVVMTVLEELW